jgi:hypothetical protein
MYIRRLTEEYNVYSSVIKICLSVITDERVCVSCSDSQCNQNLGSHYSIFLRAMTLPTRHHWCRWENSLAPSYPNQQN